MQYPETDVSPDILRAGTLIDVSPLIVIPAMIGFDRHGLEAAGIFNIADPKHCLPGWLAQPAAVLKSTSIGPERAVGVLWSVDASLQDRVLAELVAGPRKDDRRAGRL